MADVLGTLARVEVSVLFGHGLSLIAVTRIIVRPAEAFDHLVNLPLVKGFDSIVNALVR